ncbi:MAG: nuclear transport factor 2 family protein [Thermoguttaceae bacterium]
MNDGTETIAGGPTLRNRPPFTTAAFTPETAADVVSIQQLLSRYCHALDSDATEPAVIAAMFAEDGVVLPAYENDKTHTGRAAIEKWYAGYLAAVRAGGRLRRHLITTTRIEVQGDKAWAFSMLDASGIPVKGDSIGFYIGSYEDHLVRRDGRWFFASRRIALDYTYRNASYKLARNGAQIMEGRTEQ